MAAMGPGPGFLFVLLMHVFSLDRFVSAQAIVRTNATQYRGNVEQVHGKSVTYFLGIPYAEERGANGRFRAPMKWGRRNKDQIYEANQPKNRCVKAPLWTSFIDYEKHANKSHVPLNKTLPLEDCLYLDIFIPRDISTGGNVPLYPVAIVLDESEDALKLNQDVSYMAAEGDVIAISVDYRSGVFGFLSTGGEQGSGNYGLLDQQHAINWVKDNIRFFGGDPNKLTLVGLGVGGGVYGGLQALSSTNNNLLKKVILHDGSPLHPAVMETNPAKKFSDLLRAVDCPLQPEVEAMGCLRRLPATHLHVASLQLSLGDGYGFRPVVDQRFLRAHPLNLLNTQVSYQTNFLIGMTMHARKNMADILRVMLKDLSPEGDTVNELQELAEQYFGTLATKVGEMAAIEYSSCMPETTDTIDVMADLLLDMENYSPSDLLARRLSRLSPITYYYIYDGSSRNGRGRRYNEQVIGVWMKFIKDGNSNPTPPEASDTVWPPYDLANKYFFWLPHTAGQETPDGGQNPGRDYRGTPMAFWNEYVYRMRLNPTCPGGTKSLCKDPSSSESSSVDSASSRAVKILTAFFVISLVVNLILLGIMARSHIAMVCRRLHAKCNKDSVYHRDGREVRVGYAGMTSGRPTIDRKNTLERPTPQPQPRLEFKPPERPERVPKAEEEEV